MQNEEQQSWNDFAKQYSEETKKLTRELFSLFKNNAFPEAKRDALDYETVCLIEDEFRRQENDCVNVVDVQFNQFCDKSSQCLEQYKHMLNAYSKMVAVLSENFIIGIKGHHFTYFVDSLPVPPYLADKFFQEAEKRHNEFLLKQEKRVEQLGTVFQKAIERNKKERIDVEETFENTCKEILDVILPASHKRIEAIINQNYLQRVGAIHGMN